MCDNGERQELHRNHRRSSNSDHGAGSVLIQTNRIGSDQQLGVSGGEDQPQPPVRSVQPDHTHTPRGNHQPGVTPPTPMCVKRSLDGVAGNLIKPGAKRVRARLNDESPDNDNHHGNQRDRRPHPQRSPHRRRFTNHRSNRNDNHTRNDLPRLAKLDQPHPDQRQRCRRKIDTDRDHSTRTKNPRQSQEQHSTGHSDRNGITCGDTPADEPERRQRPREAPCEPPGPRRCRAKVRE